MTPLLDHNCIQYTAIFLQYIDIFKPTRFQLLTTSLRTPCYTSLDSFVYRLVRTDISSFGMHTTAGLHDILESQKCMLSSKSNFTGLHLNPTSTSTFDCVWFVPLLNCRIDDKDCTHPFQFVVDHGNLFLWTT